MAPGTVILELSNPELQQSVKEAELAYQSAQANYNNRKTELESTLLQQQAAVAGVKSQYEDAVLQLEAQEKLFKDGLISEIQVKQSRSREAELKNRLTIEERRLTMSREGIKSQLAPQSAAVDQTRAAYQLRVSQLDDLRVKSSVHGVLQQVPGRSRCAGRSWNEPRARCRSDQAQGGSAHRGNADERHSYRADRGSRHTERHHQGTRLADRSGARPAAPSASTSRCSRRCPRVRAWT